MRYNGTGHSGVAAFTKGQTLFILLEWKEESFIFDRSKISQNTIQTLTISSTHFYALLVYCILRGFE